jgi:OOP family OmpA-OmpF porin
MLAVAEAVSAMTELEPPPEATETDAVDLEGELNAFVADNPILFEPSSSVLTEPSLVVLDRLALEAQQFTGVAITIEGHTDSDGDPDENRTLSLFRALVVRQALIERGLSEGSIIAVGFGSEQPVLVDGAEDKLASRRVEFRVVTTP